MSDIVGMLHFDSRTTEKGKLIITLCMHAHEQPRWGNETKLLSAPSLRVQICSSTF